MSKIDLFRIANQDNGKNNKMTEIDLCKIVKEELEFTIVGTCQSVLCFDYNDMNTAAKIDFREKIIYLDCFSVHNIGSQNFILATCIWFIRRNKHKIRTDYIRYSDIMYNQNYPYHIMPVLELLMPKEDFCAQWNEYSGVDRNPTYVVSKYFMVSDFACMFRANVLGLLTF